MAKQFKANWPIPTRSPAAQECSSPRTHRATLAEAAVLRRLHSQCAREDGGELRCDDISARQTHSPAQRWRARLDGVDGAGCRHGGAKVVALSASTEGGAALDGTSLRSSGSTSNQGGWLALVEDRTPAWTGDDNLDFGRGAPRTLLGGAAVALGGNVVYRRAAHRDGLELWLRLCDVGTGEHHTEDELWAQCLCLRRCGRQLGKAMMSQLRWGGTVLSWLTQRLAMVGAKR
jgi:hypothetical protein